MSVILEPTPDVKEHRVLVGTTIRKSPAIVRAYLDSLASQVLPPGVVLSYHFVLDTDDASVIEMVRGFVGENGSSKGVVDVMAGVPEQDFSDAGPVTHDWKPTAMARVGRLKNRILHAAKVDKNVDAVWLCDADLICDTHTLRSLWYADVPVACAVYWTRWNNHPTIHAAPQVWLRHPYILDGRGYPDEGVFRAALKTRQLTRVWGQGACTLIRRQVLEAGVDFSYLPGVSQEGMMAGEDRHFCLACESRHISMMADPWPHIFHVYHPSDIPNIEPYKNVLESTHQFDKPSWINVRLRLLEPIQVAPNQWGHVPAHVVRVRVGAGQMLPDLEAQLLMHLDGEPFIAQVNYPASYPVPPLRHQRRLMEATVIDAKADIPFPVLGDETPSGFDLTAYTAPQIEALRVGV